MRQAKGLDQLKRSTMKVRTIIGIAVAAVGLTSTALADKYNDLVAKGYRWITTDGPFACRSKDDLQRLIKDQSDENSMRMVSQGGVYYLIRGVIVQMVQEDKASGMSQVHWDGIVGDLWMPSKFLSKPPITNILGTISLPGQSLSGRSTCPALTASWTQRQHPAQPQLQRTAKPQNLQQAQRPDLALTESCPALRRLAPPLARLR
jgi:hypothetical protein